ncbi:MAG: triose-phosphate isomerase [bacterium]|nr:triose-phosphate isomerase [bacterium]
MGDVNRTKRYVVGNWKMNTQLADAIVLGEGIKYGVESLSGVEVVLCPPFVWLYPLAEMFSQGPTNLSLGAQNMHWEEKGTYTGEISPLMLKDLVKYVILGHSERRYHFNETDEMINDKVISALDHNITPILCIGEWKKSESGDVEGLTKQLKAGLAGLEEAQLKKIIIAYEPVWAISKGDTSGQRAASGEYAGEVVGKIRSYMEKEYGRAVSENIPILYGGSATADNIKEYMFETEIDGVLAGGASLKIDNFLQVCKAVGEYR